MNRLLKWLRIFGKNVKESTLMRATIALVIAIYLGLIFYGSGKSEDIGQLLDLRLAITLAIVEIPLFMFTPILYRAILDESRKNAEATKRLSDEEKHKIQLVNKIYKKLLTVKLQHNQNQAFLEVERYNDDELNPIIKNQYPADALYVPYDKLEYPYLGYAIEHLKEYKEIYLRWSSAVNLLDMFNKELNSKQVEMTKNLIQQALTLFREELQKLIARLEAGEHLKGKCELGY
jgi:hypothetical protein